MLLRSILIDCQYIPVTARRPRPAAAHSRQFFFSSSAFPDRVSKHTKPTRACGFGYDFRHGTFLPESFTAAMSTGGWFLIFLIIIALGGGVAVHLHRRHLAREKARLEALAAQPQKKYWGKQLLIPADAHVCLAAQELAGRCLKLDEAPPLPLAECTCRIHCRCSYRLLEERRSKERREGFDRRGAVRYDPENPPRRSGHDRRKDKDSPFTDYVI